MPFHNLTAFIFVVALEIYWLQRYETIRKPLLHDLRIVLPFLRNLTPALRASLPKCPCLFFCHISTCLIDEKIFFLPHAALQKPQKFLKVRRVGLQLHVFRTFGHLAAVQRHTPKTFGRRDALGGQQAEGDRPFHRYVGEYS